MLRVRTLGAVTIEGGADGIRPDLRYAKHTALLLYLALAPRARTRDQLGELLWPEGKSARSLNQALVSIRHSVAEGALETGGELVRLNREAVQLDVTALAAHAVSHAWAAASALVGGDFCEGLRVDGAPEFDLWLTTERLRWRQLAVSVLAAHARDRLDAGDLPVALAVSHRACELDPLSEAAVVVRLRAMALSGQGSTAIASWRQFRSRLLEELGLEPSPEARALAERLPRGEDVPRPEPADVSRRAPLIGREVQLGALVNTWRQCRESGRPGVAVIAGDPGTGKSRLAEELLDRARLEGAAVSQVRLVPADRERRHAALIGLVRGGLLEAPGIVAAAPASLAVLQALRPDTPDFREASVEAGPELYGALLDAIGAVAEDHPVVLLLDDAHSADTETLHALAALLRDLGARPVLVVLTAESHPGRQEIDLLASRIGRDYAGGVVELEGLDSTTLTELTRWALPDMAPTQQDRVTRRVLADSAGLPLLAIELLHAVALGLDLARHERSWPAPLKTLSDTLPADLPDTIVMSIRVGFRRLSSPAQEALAVASVLGDQVSRRLLARGSGLAPADLNAALDELEWQRWLAADARGYSFRARIVRQVVERDMVSRGQRLRILEEAGPE
ncbi:MAG TPA: AAA family ATPase [Gemmatimonadales bacterium]|nr:AAA family ATPase [Gemmatimonadales bacterium]